MKKNRMFTSPAILILGIVLFSQISFSQEIHENYNGIRALSMGGAAIAVVNDETALLTNPAALGKLRDSYGTILDPELEVNTNANVMYNKSSFNPFNLQHVKDTTDASRDTYLHAKGQVFPSFVVKNFGIGIFGRRVMDAQMNTTGTALTTYYQDDLSLHLGFNLRFFDGRVKIGAVGKIISRIEIDKVLDPAAPLDLISVASEGVGLGADVGIIMAAPIALLPTLSAVVRDVGGTNFTAGSGLRLKTATQPKKVEQDIDVALALFPISGKARSSFTLEYQKITAAATATDKMRYAHLGYELNLSDLLFLRAGMNQRYWTAGFEIASERTQIQLSSYGEDIGTDGNPIEDRRYGFKFSFRF
jgi:hypothetical protein